MTDSEMDIKFNASRNKLFEKVFGKSDSGSKTDKDDASDVECTTTIQEMIAKRRAIKGLPNDPWLGEYNRQKRLGNGKIVTKIDEEKLKELKEVPDPIK